MCTHSRWIFNPYSRRSVLVRCGKCEACKQEKALARTNRIRNHAPDGFIFLFITLTYTNDYVPFISRRELLSDTNEINIYRNCSGRYIYSVTKGLRFKKERGITILGSSFVPFDFRGDYDSKNLKSLKGLDSDKIGVCYYSDLQDFFKRLRISYERYYKQKPCFDYFAVSEFGGFSYRPHFHVLLSVPSVHETRFRRLIVQNWPYADSRRTAKFVEVARDAASYVASYVNSSFSASSCLSFSAFCQKHSQSKNLGVLLDCFSISKVMEKIDSRDLHYYKRKTFDGVSDVSPLLLPKYVLNRYFPKFKGLGWLSSSTLRSVLVAPSELWKVLGDYHEDFRVQFFNYRYTYHGKSVFDRIDISTKIERVSSIDNHVYSFSRNEIYSIVIRLMHAQLYFMAETGLNAYDFADYYIRCWECYHSTLIKDSLLGIEILSDFSEFYFNSNDLIHGLVHSQSLDGLDMVPDYNLFRSTQIKSANLSQTYYLKDKTKKVVNYSMTYLGYDV